MARNPRTGDPVPLEERFIPAFKVSSEFQEKVHDKLRAAGSAQNTTDAQ
jgi:nucleoid DNA-binding protein